ncbi:ATP-dependent RNA helicase HrpA [Derxia lacustris]|uniref:ATP-dependent RNA helicase HrpA n=1 Tax=Derxia lacustris TaxID=764842 RepID=UPI000A171D9B|nr:ATP-dependent RNA helicase HrpA [Derxia lacustris]
MQEPRVRAERRPPANPVPPITFPEELPVSARRDEITRALREHQVVVVSGETGSGKTTQLPKICLALGRGLGAGGTGLIGHTQPRRLAATSVAKRIAVEIGSPVGEHVGYKIRFNDKLSPGASVKLMTDGVLLAETQSDPLLRAYDTIIIDEAHERSLNIDFLLGYLRQILPRRPDLKIVVTSATIDAARFAEHFASAKGPAPVIEVSGRMYPVEVRYRPYGDPRMDESRQRPATDPAGARADAVRARDREERDLNDAILDAVDELSSEGRGDILVFLPGEREIREAAEALRKQHHTRGGVHPEVIPLFARLSAEEQDRVFRPTGNNRRIVLATNVAETSLTVPGIRYVIDTGTARVKRYSYRQKVEQLQVEPISQASANQRAGRCGRVAAGICIRLYDEADFNNRSRFTDPEILRSSLAAVILRMKSLRLVDIEQFPFVEAPSGRAVADGYALLQELGALDERNELTAIGRELARLPLDPRIGRMLIAARDSGCLADVTVIAAALSTQDPRERPPMGAGAAVEQAADIANKRFADERSEFLAILKRWAFHEHALQHKKSNARLRDELKANFLNPLRMREWRDVHGQLHSTMAELGWDFGSAPAAAPAAETPAPAGDTTARRGCPQAPSAEPDHLDAAFKRIEALSKDAVAYERLHSAILAGLLGNIGCKTDDDGKQQRDAFYTGARGIRFLIWPGSTMAKKAGRWLMAAELVETSRLFARTVARIEPEWLEKLAPHLLVRNHSDPHWEKRSGRVSAFERATLYGLTIYHGRRVPFAKLDATQARDIFIRNALVEGDYEPRDRGAAAMLEHNLKLVREIEQLEHKSRRLDVLVDETLIHAFYDALLPPEAVGAVEFEGWYRDTARQQPRLLFLSRDDVMRHEAAGITTDQFPKKTNFGGVEMALDYHFEPGSPRDGVTLSVPLYALNLVSEARCDWLVPGMVKEKAQLLIKSLPQKLRRHCVPLPEYAEGFVARHPAAGDGDLVLALIADLRAQRQLNVLVSDFKRETLPAHLAMNFRVVDEHGRQLGIGRSLGALRAELGRNARAEFQKLAAAVAMPGLIGDGVAPAEAAGPGAPAATAPARAGLAGLQGLAGALRAGGGNGGKAGATQPPGHAGAPNAAGKGAPAGKPQSGPARLDGDAQFTDWTFGELPELVEIQRKGGQVLIGYPALVDADTHCRLEVFDEPDEAARAHRRGLKRLVALQLKEPLKYLDKNIPGLSQMAVQFMSLGSQAELKQQILDLALERACLADPLPATAEQFRARVQDGRGRLSLLAQEIARLAAGILAEYAAALKKLPQVKAFAPTHADIAGQLGALMTPDFLARHPYAQLAHFPRYLKGIGARIDKQRADPARDSARLAELQPLLTHLQRKLAARKGVADARLDEFRWLLEELRISLFAQELRTPMPVSVKRLQKVWEALRD